MKERDELDAKQRARQRLLSVATILVLLLIVYVAIHQRPYPHATGPDIAATEFSSGRAMAHLRQLAAHPRPVGTKENEDGAAYIQQQLVSLGFQPEVHQSSFTEKREWGTSVSYVRNISTVKKGYANTKPILLMAHYDTVITSAGAADDGAGVATLLETLRALQASPQLQNDAIFLFTDGEELGLMGSRAFVADHPWAKDIGVVLNFEARGTSGPSILFETINGDGWLVNQFASSSPYSFGNSLLPTIFKFMPNDTDLTAFKKTDVPGLNFAFAEGWSHYHGHLDSVASLDERSLQHHGENALGLTRQLGNIDLNNPPRGNSVFFNLFGSTVVHYPSSWVPVLTVIAALGVVASIVFGFRKKRLTVPGMLLGFVALPIVLVVATFVTALFVRFGGGMSTSGVPFYESKFYFAAIVCCGLAITTALYALIARWTKAENLHQGALLWWLILTIAGTVVVPEATFVFVWPLLIGTALSLYLVLRPADKESMRMGALWLAAFFVLLLIVPVAHLLFVALVGPIAFVVTVLAVLTAALLLPVNQVVARGVPAWSPSLLATASLVMFAVAVSQAKPGPAYPKEDQMFYVANLDQGKAIWATLEDREDGWTSQFFSNNGNVTELSQFIPYDVFGGARVLQRPTPVIAIDAPTLSVVEDTSDDTQRRLKLLLSSPRRSPQIAVFVESDANVQALDVNSKTPGIQPAAYSGDANGKPSNPQVSVTYYGLTANGASLVLETSKGASIKVHVVERSYDLPQLPNFQVKPRSAEFTELRSIGDGMITYRSFTF
ncbi:MAG TPA: M20/M25/M40 family metallo-hydrolase [Pyrinomonadaceae bacterium]|nr:M20/M25/M40 family metallo-hydrolase [Pyrinomonadaceae bacterium]